ncbi:MAG: hypothetical protein K0041_09075 [Acidithiobacillus sp.]|nr:hypothetical protein [Acidithiobacillus sp.]
MKMQAKLWITARITTVADWGWKKGQNLSPSIRSYAQAMVTLSKHHDPHSFKGKEGFSTAHGAIKRNNKKKEENLLFISAWSLP